MRTPNMILLLGAALLWAASHVHAATPAAGQAAARGCAAKAPRVSADFVLQNRFKTADPVRTLLNRA